MSTRLKLYLYIMGVTLVVMLGIGMAIGAFAIAPAVAAPPAAATPAADAVAEYHRGIYDICRSVLKGSTDQCLQAVAAAQAGHWYEQDSVGWKWPVADRAGK